MNGGELWIAGKGVGWVGPIEGGTGTGSATTVVAVRVTRPSDKRSARIDVDMVYTCVGSLFFGY
jgi:hypothetical protein